MGRTRPEQASARPAPEGRLSGNAAVDDVEKAGWRRGNPDDAGCASAVELAAESLHVVDDVWRGRLGTACVGVEGDEYIARVKLPVRRVALVMRLRRKDKTAEHPQAMRSQTRPSLRDACRDPAQHTCNDEPRKLCALVCVLEHARRGGPGRRPLSEPRRAPISAPIAEYDCARARYVCAADHP